MKKIILLLILLAAVLGGLFWYYIFLNTNKSILVEKISTKDGIKVDVIKLKAGQSIENNSKYPMKIIYKEKKAGIKSKISLKTKRITGSVTPGGKITLPSIETQTKERVRLKVSAGTVRFKVGKLQAAEKFNVITPAVICGVRGTYFSVGHEKNNTTVKVPRGSVAVVKPGEEKETVLSQGYKIEVSKQGVKDPVKMSKKELEEELNYYKSSNFFPDVMKLYKEAIRKAYGMPFKLERKNGQLICDLSGNNRVYILDPIKNIPIKNLNISHTAVSNIKPLAGMPLKSLNLENTQVYDITPLKGKPIKSLYLGNTKVHDISSLKGMPLQTLTLWGTSVTDIAPIKNMKLTWLSIAETGLSDISILKNMRTLSFLSIYQTSVSDISPVTGLKLRTLLITPSRLASGWESKVKKIKTLKILGTSDTDYSEKQSPDKFWEKY